MPSELAQRADVLRGLHHADVPLVLPNAWDAASARAVAAAGFPAVATTSGGMAESLGWADHQHTPPEEMFAALARITRVVQVPVTADVEAGYGLDAGELVERLLAAGVVGCNLEDTDHGAHALRDADAQAAFLAEVKAAARARGVDLVVNARIDVFVRDPPSPEAARDEALRRGRLYRDAGADCVYPILARGRQLLQTLVQELACPVNAMCTPGGLELDELAAIGIRRISYGGGLFRASLDGFVTALEKIR